MTQVRCAGLIICRRKDNILEYLLLQSSKGTHHWMPPKGHVEPGEDEKCTAIRETQEESGIVADDYVMDPTFQTSIAYKLRLKRTKTVAFWLAVLKSPDISVKLSSEHKDYGWFTIDKAIDRTEFNDVKEMLRSANDHLIQS